MQTQSTAPQVAILQNAIADISQQITAYSQLYNSKNYQGLTTAIGIDVNTGDGFSHTIEVDSDDEELRQYFNMRGATLICRRTLLQTQLAALLTDKADELKHEHRAAS